MQKFADQLSGYFVPTVVMISIVTWIIWLVIGFTDITLLRKKFDVSVLYSEKTEGRNFNRRDKTHNPSITCTQPAISAGK